MLLRPLRLFPNTPVFFGLCLIFLSSLCFSLSLYRAVSALLLHREKNNTRIFSFSLFFAFFALFLLEACAASCAAFFFSFFSFFFFFGNKTVFHVTQSGGSLDLSELPKQEKARRRLAEGPQNGTSRGSRAGCNQPGPRLASSGLAEKGTLWQALAGFSRPSFPSFLHQKKPPTPAASTAENRSSGKSLNGCSHKRKQVRRLDLSLQ